MITYDYAILPLKLKIISFLKKIIRKIDPTSKRQRNNLRCAKNRKKAIHNEICKKQIQSKTVSVALQQTEISPFNMPVIIFEVGA